MFLGFCTFIGKLYSDILSSYIHGQCVIFCLCIYVTIKRKIITRFFQDYFLFLGKKLLVSQDMSTSRVTTGILPLGPSSNSCASCYVWSTQSWNWMDMLLCLLPPKTGSLSPVVSDLWGLLTQIKLINCHLSWWLKAFLPTAALPGEQMRGHPEPMPAEPNHAWDRYDFSQPIFTKVAIQAAKSWSLERQGYKKDEQTLQSVGPKLGPRHRQRGLQPGPKGPHRGSQHVLSMLLY